MRFTIGWMLAVALVVAGVVIVGLRAGDGRRRR